MVVIPLLVADIAICLSWRQLVRNYKKLVNLGIDKLRAMDELPEMSWCYKMCLAEDVLDLSNGQGNVKPRKGLNFSDLERWIPWVFLGLYTLFLIGVIVLPLGSEGFCKGIAMGNHPTIIASFGHSARRVLLSFWDQMGSERI